MFIFVSLQQSVSKTLAIWHVCVRWNCNVMFPFNFDNQQQFKQYFFFYSQFYVFPIVWIICSTFSWVRQRIHRPLTIVSACRTHNLLYLASKHFNATNIYIYLQHTKLTVFHIFDPVIYRFRRCLHVAFDGYIFLKRRANQLISNIYYWVNWKKIDIKNELIAVN